MNTTTDQNSEHVTFLEAHPEIGLIELLIADGNGILRGKRITRDKLAAVYEEGILLPGSIFCLDTTGANVEGVGLIWRDGDADRVCRVVPGTLKPVPWHRKGLAQVLLTMHEEDGEPFFAEPRHVLQNLINRFTKMGLKPVTAVELEFYLIDKNRTPAGHPQPPISPISGLRHDSPAVYGIDELYDYDDFIDEVAATAKAQGIPADTMVAEYAPGQYEVNLHHVDDPLLACDQAILLKRLIKHVAQRHDMEATFMAKPYTAESGNGTHIHVSLLDENGKNVFQGPGLHGEERLSDEIKWAMGGMNASMVESMALLAPNANSYRRFQLGSYAPHTPCWGINNRTVALRIPAGHPSATRIEHRVAGADASPHLVMSAVLAGILYGLENKIDPGPRIKGNAYEQLETTLPIIWPDAIDAFESATILPEYLGKEYCEIFTMCRRAERQRFNSLISPVEFDWYLRTV
ncbi:glutamine synthetase family protein [Kiloniella laminariae]|uniref:Glutamine synthetase family protein n=1 Tax=Kiloniella laminariae TaxID=454162 RepID=A0ABT4LS77_9PROT|nr:glutamine synthetase family protein [Kiloniella laminariae]MCZ4282792.1 glutamine synthetase family protein [Kiloniella laminariae]